MKIRQMVASFFFIAAPASGAVELTATEQTFLTGVTSGDHAARPIAILVMAVGRSGSTMVGEFFDQNEVRLFNTRSTLKTAVVSVSRGKQLIGTACVGRGDPQGGISSIHQRGEDVLYFYEPCRNPRRHIEGLECLALLKRLTQCTFSPEDSAWLSGDKNALRRGSSELQYISEADDTEQFVRAHDQLIETCKQRRAVAVKSIRLYDGLGGEDYDVSGFKVLHLVRDPRGVVRSQQENFKDSEWGSRKGTDSTTRARAGGISICETYKSQLDTSKKLEESRYLLVRYEDIATSPELAVELIYCWSGLGVVPANVETWIHLNMNMPTCDDGAHRKRHLRSKTMGSSFGYAYTLPEYPFAGNYELDGSMREDQNAFGLAERGMGEERALSTGIRRRTQVSGDGQVSGGSSSSSEETLAECLENNNEAERNPYGTRRQSANMVSLWRTLMPAEDAQAVWDACQESEVMGSLGYYL